MKSEIQIIYANSKTMKIYSTLSNYIPESKINDKIVFGGRGILNGINNITSKHDVYKVVEVQQENIIFKEFRGKKRLLTTIFDQEIALLTKNEFKELPILW